MKGDILSSYITKHVLDLLRVHIQFLHRNSVLLTVVSTVDCSQALDDLHIRYIGHRMILVLQACLPAADTGLDILTHRRKAYHPAVDPLNWAVSVDAVGVVLNPYVLDVRRNCQPVEDHMDYHVDL